MITPIVFLCAIIKHGKKVCPSKNITLHLSLCSQACTAMATACPASRSTPHRPWSRVTSPPRSTARRTATRSPASNGTRTARSFRLRSGRIGFCCRRGRCSSSAWYTGRRTRTAACIGASRGMSLGLRGARTLRLMSQVRFRPPLIVALSNIH